MPEATNLVPEFHLMSKLSPIWRKRFEQALLLMHDEKELTWEEIAEQCAISSYHFLRMFRLVFNETPGHYKARTRLQGAVSSLIDSDEISMTEIAYQEGYSSSQALAKALKRELGYSAKEIRKMAQYYDQIQPILNKLGHPLDKTGNIVENNIALGIPFKIVTHPERHFQVRALSPPSFNAAFKLWNSSKPAKPHRMINLMSMEEWDKPVESQKIYVGYEVNESSLSNHSCHGGEYLCCRVILDNENSYFAVWDSFLNYSITHDIEFVEQTFVIEEIHNPDQVLTEPADISFYAAIKRTEKQ